MILPIVLSARGPVRYWMGLLASGVLGMTASGAGFSNHPYPWEGESDGATFYSGFETPPKNLDPQVSYTTWDGLVVSMCYESLLSYDYYERPLKLIPQLATSVPKAERLTRPDGSFSGTLYRFELQQGIRFCDDPCFPEGKGREVTASDFIYAFKRLADPKTNCPVTDSFGHIKGLKDYREKVRGLSEAARLDQSRQGSFAFYKGLGEIAGVRQTGKYTFEVELEDEYPQILYWLAMRFISAVSHEAIDMYDGSIPLGANRGPNDFNQRPVGTGPFRPEWEGYRREGRMIYVRNENYWGAAYPERKAPGTFYPDQPFRPEDEENGAWVRERAGQPIPGYDRVEWYLDKEQLPRFNKFLQGYYDFNLIPRENFSAVVGAGRDALTPEMEERGVKLVKDVSMDVRYIGFNMQDDHIGHPVKFADPEKEKNREVWLEKNRKLRKAMSLVIDSQEFLRIFQNGLGVPAQFMLPPGIFGYDETYKNPYRESDAKVALEKAQALLKEAGYENGIDPETGKALSMSFVAGRTDTRNKAIYNFFIKSWRELGIDVVLEATEYNTFQEKMYEGRFQMFYWGWMLDYPDPENFLFLLYGANSGKYNPHAPNHAWYENAAYDEVFKRMETLENEASASWSVTNSQGVVETKTATRTELIQELRGICEEDVPWIPLFHSVEFYLSQPWMDSVQPHPITGPWYKFYGVDKSLRDEKRAAWNKPVVWPALFIPLIVIAVVLPAMRVVLKERR